MVNLEKIEFLSLAYYLSELKGAISLLYKESNSVMSKSALDDLDQISFAEIASKFTIKELTEWQQGNELLGIKSYVDFLNFTFLTINEKINHQLSGENSVYIPSINKALNQEELRIARSSLGHWDAFSNLFYRRINNPDTLKIILKNSDDTQAKISGYVTTGDENDIVAFYRDRIGQSSSIIRQKIIDLENISTSISGMVVDEQLPTTLTEGEWQKIFFDLVDWKYLPEDYKSNSKLINDWLSFAFINAQEEKNFRRGQKLRWIGDLISLAQFIMILIEGKAIPYKENDKSRLYTWVKRTIEYTGEDKTLETNLRRAFRNKVQCFHSEKSPEGNFIFKILQTARKPKNS